MPAPAILTRWAHDHPVTDLLIEEAFRREGLEPHWWANGPGDVYREHEHPYHKVVYCGEGSITFLLTPTGEQLLLRPGDRLDLPAGWPHQAFVGPHGVRCAESEKPQTA